MKDSKEIDRLLHEKLKLFEDVIKWYMKVRLITREI